MCDRVELCPINYLILIEFWVENKWGKGELYQILGIWDLHRSSKLTDHSEITVELIILTGLF